MLGIPPIRRLRRRPWRGPGGAASLAILVLVLAAPAAAIASPTERAADPAARPGAFCEPGECRPRDASAWTPVAFAFTVWAIHRTSRRQRA